MSAATNDEGLSVSQAAKSVSLWMERGLAATLLVGVLAFAVQSSVVLARMNWAENETLYEMIYRALLLVIGIELIRTLVPPRANSGPVLAAARHWLRPPPRYE